jgi:hypothetical protein
MNKMMRTSSAIKAALFLAALAATASGNAASAASNCPGGGVEKCTPKCTGPVLNPVCTYGPPCTCSLPKGSDKLSASRNRTPTRNPDVGISGGNIRPGRDNSVLGNRSGASPSIGGGNDQGSSRLRKRD